MNLGRQVREEESELGYVVLRLVSCVGIDMWNAECGCLHSKGVETAAVIVSLYSSKGWDEVWLVVK